MESDRVEPAAAAEDIFNATSLGPQTTATIDRLGDLSPSTLALMHGPAFHGDGGGQLRDLAQFYRDRLAAQS